MRASLNQTSFVGGEISPRAIGRTDLDRYATAVKRARNAHPVVTGGMRRRDGSLFVADALTTTAGGSILIPFVKGRDEAWMVEFGNLTLRIYTMAGVFTGVTLATPYGTSALSGIDWAQSEATMYLFHANAPIHRLQRLGTGTWVISEAPFTTEPFAEVGSMPSVSLTLSSAAVGAGRTVTAGGSTFVAADVGRAIIYDAGIAVITAYTSATEVTAEITRAFPSTTIAADAWTLEGSPQSALTPSAAGPVGATITLTLGANGWRSTDVPGMVRVNGGLVRLTAYSSATIVSGTVVRELSGTTAAPALAWTLEPFIWSAALGYPRTGTVHQQRLIAAGTTRFPRTVWGSRIGEPLDFELGTVDDQAFAFTIDSDEASAIAYVSSAKDLMVMTQSGEYSMRGGVEKPITPTNVRVIQESNHGSAGVRPAQIGRETLFVQRAGKKIRALGYRYDFDGYASPDISALADHMLKPGIVWLAFQQEPDPLLWVALADGTFATCTIDRDQNPSVIGWALQSTPGSVECVAAAPFDGREWVWAIVRRTINGVAERFLERFDGTFEPLVDDARVYGTTVDCGVVIDGPATTFTAPHLPNTVVRVVADGSEMGDYTTNGSGQITLPRSADRVLIGLRFDTRITLLTPEFGTGEGSAQGNAARTGEVTLRFLETIGASVEDAEGNRQTIPFRRFGENVLDRPPQPFTGFVRTSKLGWNRGESELSILQTQALPMHLLAVIRKHTSNS